MEHAKILVRTVARAFYETEHVIVADALAMHSALSAADISIAMHLSPSNSNKIVQRLIAKLREGGLVSVFTRQETRDGSNKPQARDYYYIDYRRAIDSTKYRVHILHEQIKAASSSTGQDEKKEWRCTRCSSQFTAMEVLDTTDARGRFTCKRCGFVLSEIGEENVEINDRTALFNKQFGNILQLLQKIDDCTIPESTGEQALSDARPMPRNEVLNPAPKLQVMPQLSRPTAVKGQVASGPEKIEVSITSGTESTEAEAAAKQRYNAEMAARNTLPEWHTRSTVTGELVRESTPAAVKPVASNEGNNAEDEKSAAELDQMDHFYEQLEEERAAKKDGDEEEEEEEEDEESDSFEDIPIITGEKRGLPELDSDPEPKRARLVEESVAVDVKVRDESDEDEDDFENVM